MGLDDFDLSTQMAKYDPCNPKCHQSVPSSPAFFETMTVVLNASFIYLP